VPRVAQWEQVLVVFSFEASSSAASVESIPARRGEGDRSRNLRLRGGGEPAVDELGVAGIELSSDPEYEWVLLMEGIEEMVGTGELGVSCSSQ
jgi:hypothetical protein